MTGRGTPRDNRGARNAAAKLTAAAVVKIREAYASGASTTFDLAARYGVSYQTISKIVRGRLWLSAGGPITTNAIRRNGGDTRSPAAQAGRAPRPRAKAAAPAPAIVKVTISVPPPRYCPPLRIHFRRTCESTPWVEVPA